PPMLDGKRLRIFYLAQVDVKPPRFVLFVNNPKLMVETYKKYLINQFRDTYGFLGAPIRFFLKGRNTKEEKAKQPALTPQFKHNPLLENEELIFEEDDLSEEEFKSFDPSYF